MREFKKLRRLLQRKRHIKIELCARLRVLRLYHVAHLYKISEVYFRLLGKNGFHLNEENERFIAAVARCRQNHKSKFHVVIWQTTSKNYIKKRAARAARLFLLIQPIISSICGVVVVVVVVISQIPYCITGSRQHACFLLQKCLVVTPFPFQYIKKLATRITRICENNGC